MIMLAETIMTRTLMVWTRGPQVTDHISRDHHDENIEVVNESSLQSLVILEATIVMSTLML